MMTNFIKRFECFLEDGSLLSFVFHFIGFFSLLSLQYHRLLIKCVIGYILVLKKRIWLKEEEEFNSSSFLSLRIDFRVWKAANFVTNGKAR